jgi:hypothetical protein
VSAYVVVHFARSLGRAPASVARAFGTAVTAHDGTVLPADARGGETKHATVQVPDMERATRLAAAVRDLEGVETAYAKPGEELP